MSKTYLPIVVENLPAEMIFCGRAVRPEVQAYMDQGVIKVIAGPELVHLAIDIKRPYVRPRRPDFLEHLIMADAQQSAA